MTEIRICEKQNNRKIINNFRPVWKLLVLMSYKGPDKTMAKHVVIASLSMIRQNDH